MASFSDDWDTWFFPNYGSSSAVFNSPVLSSGAYDSGLSASENEPAQVASGGDQGRDETEAEVVHKICAPTLWMLGPLP